MMIYNSSAETEIFTDVSDVVEGYNSRQTATEETNFHSYKFNADQVVNPGRCQRIVEVDRRRRPLVTQHLWKIVDKIMATVRRYKGQERRHPSDGTGLLLATGRVKGVINSAIVGAASGAGRGRGRGRGRPTLYAGIDADGRSLPDNSLTMSKAVAGIYHYWTKSARAAAAGHRINCNQFNRTPTFPAPSFALPRHGRAARAAATATCALQHCDFDIFPEDLLPRSYNRYINSLSAVLHRSLEGNRITRKKYTSQAAVAPRTSRALRTAQCANMFTDTPAKFKVLDNQIGTKCPHFPWKHSTAWLRCIASAVTKDRRLTISERRRL
ncbi:hypothetical protein EVAR_83231_1 [Eumeta japonica]|uniref:Uncharacterized protein n=1 Tax=Eumeta variegata TaxID=151549 RepID=A0A4C1Y3H8_EUMVA|nr:hypothetical protein EVAR_83231_1 [Eumeta japonica]